MNQIIYKMELFEGPLDLLLSLIHKNKMSIEDIQISIIFDQYMDYIKTMQALDIELSTEFIVMASQLMLIKSRMLFPKQDDEDEEDPRAALAAALLEYKKAKEAANEVSASQGTSVTADYIKEMYGEHYLENVVVMGKVMDFLYENAKIK